MKGGLNTVETYKLIRILNRKNKEGKTYYLAVVLLSNETDCDLLRILVTPEQVAKLNDLLKQNKIDLKEYISIQYNQYQKCYQPKINI